MIASADVSSIAAPTPFAARARFSANAEGARPQPSEASANAASPAISIFFLPMRSASAPAGSRHAANATM